MGLFGGGKGVRIDKFLKVSRIIKRRTVANEACSQGRVLINGKVAKPSTEVKVGDVIEIQFGEHIRRFEVLSVSEHVAKGEASKMYREL
nr:RNA-binding S4 domain-containing protein [Caldicoprobacter algeriensis]